MAQGRDAEAQGPAPHVLQPLGGSSLKRQQPSDATPSAAAAPSAPEGPPRSWAALLQVSQSGGGGASAPAPAERLAEPAADTETSTPPPEMPAAEHQRQRPVAAALGAEGRQPGEREKPGGKRAGPAAARLQQPAPLPGAAPESRAAGPQPLASAPTPVPIQQSPAAGAPLAPRPPQSSPHGFAFQRSGGVVLFHGSPPHDGRPQPPLPPQHATPPGVPMPVLRYPLPAPMLRMPGMPPTGPWGEF
jgi:hypothetical protein